MFQRILLFIFITLLIVGCKEEVKKDVNLTKLIEDKNSKKDENRTTPIDNIDNIIVYTDEQLELKEELERYLEQLKSLNIEGIIDMTYPKLFIPINKNMFKRYLNTVISSKDITIESFDVNITDIGEIQSFSNGKFATVEYRSIIKLAFINPNLYSDELSMRVLNDTLTDKYGSDNIKIDAKNREIVIKRDEKLLAIKEQDSDWKFIGDNREYRRLYPQIIPLDILSQI